MGSTPIALQNALRRYQTGDNWTHTITGTATSPGQPSQSVTGTMTSAVTAQFVNGTQTLALAQTIDVMASGGARIVNNAVNYFVQDPVTGNAASFAEKTGTDPLRIVTNNPLPVGYPGTWSLSTSSVANIIYLGGSTETETLAVTGIESVQSGVGLFSTYRANVSSSDSLYGTSNGTQWWAPHIGAPIRMTTTITDSTGAALSVTAVLQSTNVQ